MIINYDIYKFYDEVLKPRSVLFKGNKNVKDILKVKLKHMGGGSLLKLNKTESQTAEKAFDLILNYIKLI